MTRRFGGGGAVLYRENLPEAYFEVEWAQVDLSPIGLAAGNEADQSAFEFLTLLLVLTTWGDSARESGMALFGDNIAALQCAVTLKGKRALTAVSRELGWRRIRHGGWYAVGHIPAEGNVLADALSRTSAPEGSERKTKPDWLQQLPRVTPAKLPIEWETLL